MPSPGILKALQDIDSGIVTVSSDTYSSLLRGCTHLSDVALVHTHISGNGWIHKTFVANLAIQMCGAIGGAAYAWHVFSTMPVRNHYSWNIALGAQTRHEEMEYAQALFQKMPHHDTVSWNLMLGAYSQAGNLYQAKNIFCAIPCRSSVTWNAMSQAYIKHGKLEEARVLFDQAPGKNVVSWNALIHAYADNGHLQQSCRIFAKMPLADIISWTTIVTAHVAQGHLGDARAYFQAMPERSHVAWNAMAQASFQEGDVATAMALFEEMPRDCSSWTSMISGFARNDRMDDARAVFERMPAWNAVSWNAMAVAAVESDRPGASKALFDENPERNLVSWNAMVQGAGKYSGISAARDVFDRMPAWDVISFTTVVAVMAAGGEVDEATVIFDAMPERNIVSWNAMMAGYAQNGDPSSAMALFKSMDLEGMRPNAVSFVVALDSCANLAALADGVIVLAEISLQGDDLSKNLAQATGRSNLLHDQLDPRNYPMEWAESVEISHQGKDFLEVLWQQFELGNAAINLFGKCGQLDQARWIFDAWRKKPRHCHGDVMVWNTIIAAYAQNGMGHDAIDLLAHMNLDGIDTDNITLLNVLAASSGISTRSSIDFFQSINADYGSIHSREQFLCLADALGRSGMLAEALEVVLAMPYAANLIAWTTLLSACKSHGEVEIGEEAATRTSEMWPQSPAPYIALSSIWRSTGRGGVERARNS